MPATLDRLDGDPLAALWAAVRADASPAREWHASNLATHEARYRADLALIGRLGPEGALLDVGAAPCHMTALLQLAGHAVMGVDAAPERVGAFVERMGLDVRACDVERAPLPFPDGSIHGVLLCETFEHLRVDPPFVLSQINRVLATGGFLLLTTPNLYSLPSIGRYALGKSLADPLTEFGKLRGLGHMGHVREYSAREVMRFVQAFGFAVQSLGFRHQAGSGGRRGRALSLAYRLVPRRFHRDIVLVARKAVDVPRLAPLP